MRDKRTLRSTGTSDGHAIGADLNLAVWRDVVQGFLKQKLDEIRSNPRFQDRGYYDDDRGEYVERGGIWNDRSGRCADGVTRADVEDIQRILRKVGLHITFDEADALLIRYARTGYLSDIVVRAQTPTGLQPILDLRWPSQDDSSGFSVNGFQFVRAASGVFLARETASRALADVHVIFQAESTRCICGQECAALRAFASRRLGAIPRRTVSLQDAQNGPPMREALEIARRLGMGQIKGRAAGRPTDNLCNALLLIAQGLYGRQFKSSPDVARMMEGGDLPKRHRNAPALFKKRSSVLRALRAIYALASNTLKSEGINLPECPSDSDADQLIASCCEALRLRSELVSIKPMALAA